MAKKVVGGEGADACGHEASTARPSGAGCCERRRVRVAAEPMRKTKKLSAKARNAAVLLQWRVRLRKSRKKLRKMLEVSWQSSAAVAKGATQW